MTLKYADRVQETFTTTGTGTISLGGAVVGYQAFSAALSNGDTCYYAATDGTNWEVGLGTFASAGDTLARTTILASSNSNTAVSWSAGTKNIWLDLPALALGNLISSLTTTGTSGAATLTGGVLNIPQYSGKVVQRVNASLGTAASTATTIPQNGSQPTASSGGQILSTSITPQNASNRLIAFAKVNFNGGGGGRPCAILLRSDTTNAVDAASGVTTTSQMATVSLQHDAAAGGTSAITFSVNVGDSSGTCYVNGWNGTQPYGASMVCSLEVFEITP